VGGRRSNMEEVAGGIENRVIKKRTKGCADKGLAVKRDGQ